MNLKVKTVWHGKVAIRDKYIEDIKPNEDINISVLGEGTMRVPAPITDKIVGYSHRKFKDEYSNQYHRLCYFQWKPTSHQERLI
jgi:hypothetical protein